MSTIQGESRMAQLGRQVVDKANKLGGPEGAETTVKEFFEVLSALSESGPLKSQMDRYALRKIDYRRPGLNAAFNGQKAPVEYLLLDRSDPDGPIKVQIGVKGKLLSHGESKLISNAADAKELGLHLHNDSVRLEAAFCELLEKLEQAMTSTR